MAVQIITIIAKLQVAPSLSLSWVHTHATTLQGI